ncbi:MAG TPA: TIM44-like domain-containing protein, partial [Myxococcota bacterium]|nr:TIM44-like domain-containing protein [Myxococcota bacterium]
ARTLRDPGLAAALRAFRGRHPAFDRAAAEARFQHVFVALQEAWGKGRWDDARPYTTDMAWNTLRFWIDRYQRAGLVNRVADARVESMELARVTVDAWYESFTLHIRATLRDWVEDANTHKVVAGDPDAEHRFSEYWTFIRAVGSGDASGDPTRCPSCGAPLDRVNAAGTCGYCDSVITTGRFDWVLSRIEQAEVYRG